MKALYFNEFGDSSVLKYGEVSDPVMNENEILVEMKSIGVNFADIYRRKGNYHLAGEAPFVLGYEGSGVVKAVGGNVTYAKVGQRVAFADVPFSNAELVVVPEEKIIKIPDGISFDTAASILLQGLTAQYLLSDSYNLSSEGETVLVHAAAGGVGQNLVQLAKAKGAKVIGLTSSDEKAKVVTAKGADHVFLYDTDWVNAVQNINGGVDVAYDSVGSTLEQSFAATKTGGAVVFYGMAGGDPALVDPRMLMDTSKTLTGGDLWNVLTSHNIRQERANQLFTAILNKDLMVSEPTVFALSEGQAAHDLLESRKSTGKLLLRP